MLTVKELKPNVYELTLQGVLEKSDAETMERELTPALKGGGPLGLIVRAEGWKDITANALAEDMKFEFSLLTQWAKIARMAVVTDLQAFSALLKWIDPILPMIEMRSFAPSEISAAERWAADVPKKGMASGPGVRIVDEGSDSLLVFEIDGKMREEGVDRVFATFDRAVKKIGKINLMVRVKDYEGFDLGLFGDRDFMTSKLGSIGKIGRYAIVGAPGWMRAMVQSVGPLLPIEMRTFDASEDAHARAWATAG